jgi:intracellular sulfur oxidation DsrE/DsrF family protein
MSILRNFTFILLTFCIVLSGETEFAEPKPSMVNPRQILFSINSADDEEIHHVLSTANNILKFYGPESVQIRIVAYYHGIKMLLKKDREIALRVEALALLDVEFVACGNTMVTKNIKEEELVENVYIVTAGVAEIVERVKEGWIYIVP